MMVCGFELTDVDWSNQDVNKIVEFFSKKFDVQDKEIARQCDELVQKDDVIARQGDTIAQLQDRIKQLEEEVAQTKSRRHGGKKPRKYNTRKYKDYPHQHAPRDRPDNSDSYKFHTIQQVADIAFCPTCGKQLADTANIQLTQMCQ